MEEQAELFAGDDYLCEQWIILERLQINPDAMLPASERRVADVYLNNSSIFDSVDAPSTVDNLMLKSARYADNAEHQFSEWADSGRIVDNVRGILVGAPILKNTVTNEQVQCLHLWQNNSDILTTSVAVQLVRVAHLALHSIAYTRLSYELDELAMGAVSKYKVPLLVEQSSYGDEWLFRTAEQEDIEHAMKLLDDEINHLYYDNTHPKAPKLFHLFREFDNA